MTMLPRERVEAALMHQVTDRVPVDFWAVPAVWERMCSHFGVDTREAMLQKLGVDVRQVQPDYIGPPFRRMEDGSWFDEMGVHLRVVKNAFGEYNEYASAPLAYIEDAAELDAYPYWPNPDHFDYDGLSEKIGTLHDTYYIKLMSGGIFEYAWALRGYENFFMDMILEPEIAHGIMSRLCDFWCEFVRRVLTAAGDKYDLIYTYDDVAAQNSLLMSKEMWSEFIRPYHVKLNAVIHSFGKKVMYHSCGAVYDLIPDLAALPLDILNPIQPAAKGMDMLRIKEKYGDILCFHGAIDIQQVLPHGTPQDVRDAVAHSTQTLGKGGGYILASAHNIQADTPVENILEMYRAAGSYRG